MESIKRGDSGNESMDISKQYSGYIISAELYVRRFCLDGFGIGTDGRSGDLYFVGSRDTGSDAG